ncbi:cbb3-type cytochrome oxidase assembly protein CcoS [Luteimonas sp. TWI662]|uniref:cbb3-type cytochrome oxidase assembly protein CcoS n=1 Tax=Luteimonas sp. TWI662 TaxID=3136789 RepID=UPI00320A69B0
MRSLLLLVPISLVLLGIAIAAFVWAVRRGQFDDMDTPALDILVDDDGRDGTTHTSAGRDPEAAPTSAPQDRPRAD